MRIIAGLYRGRRLVAPPGLATRPTSERAREALMSILEHGTPPLRGSRFLDLFAGSGAVGLEALSRGAAEVVLVESARPAQNAIRRNITALGADARARLVAQDATRLGRALQPFDIAFLDPPYAAGLVEPAIDGLLAGGWLARGCRLVLELGSKEPAPTLAGCAIDIDRRYGHNRLLLARRLD